MRMLPLAVIVGTLAFGTYVSAQDKPTPKPTYTSETMLKRINGDTSTPKPTYTSEEMLKRINGGTAAALDAVNCVLPDKSERAANTTVTVDGRTFRCVEVLDSNFKRRGVAWTPVSPQP